MATMQDILTAPAMDAAKLVLSCSSSGPSGSDSRYGG